MWIFFNEAIFFKNWSYYKQDNKQINKLHQNVHDLEKSVQSLINLATV
jgi:hypothetical protein